MRAQLATVTVGQYETWPCFIFTAETCGTSTPSVLKWRRLTHPEGQPYFVLTGEFEFAVVTAATIEDVQTEGQILDYAKLATKELQYRGITVPLGCELVLELGDDYISCNYYFVDHVAKRLFWLTDVQTESFDIPPAKSPSHLGIVYHTGGALLLTVM